MKFRPEDRYCKSTIAREEQVTNLVLRVRRRKAKSGGEEARRNKEYAVDLLGVANKNYHFPGTYSIEILSSLLLNVPK